MRAFAERCRYGPACCLGRVVEVVAGTGRWGRYLRRLFVSVNGHRRSMVVEVEDHDIPQAWAFGEGYRPS